jgi:high-affinity iron transporter
MLSSFLLSLREGLEAALIIGIILGALRKINRPDLKAAVWAGAGAALLVSLAVGGALAALGFSLEGQVEYVFEGITMVLAAALLTWMIFWMNRQGRLLRAEMEGKVRQAAAAGGSRSALFGVAFLAVVREGIELAFFLTAAAFALQGGAIWLGAVLGLAAAILLGYLTFTATRQLDLRLFFQVTSVLLLLFAAGLIAHGVHEFNEAGWVPAVIEHVWDINPYLDEKSALGEILKALFGYNGNPSLTEVLAYLAYLGVAIAGIHWQNKTLALPVTEVG